MGNIELGGDKRPKMEADVLIDKIGGENIHEMGFRMELIVNMDPFPS